MEILRTAGLSKSFLLKGEPRLILKFAMAFLFGWKKIIKYEFTYFQ